MSQEDGTEIFISYYHNKDEKIAKIIKSLLGEIIFGDKKSPKVFRGEDSLFPGSIWIEEIREKLSQAKVVIVICSPESVKRPWVAFECGAAEASKKCEKIILFYHSGLEKIPGYLKNISKKHVINYVKKDIQDEAGIDKLVSVTRELLLDNNSEDNNSEVDIIHNAVKEINIAIRKEINEEDRIEERETKRDKNGVNFLPCTLTWKDDAIELKFHTENINCKKKEECIAENNRLDRLQKMHAFLNGDIKEVETGVAIGIQNCLFDVDKEQVYVGIRYKSQVDAKDTGMSLARGDFNTGYKLIRKSSDIECANRIDALQDLFSSTKVKSNVEPRNGNTSVYGFINERLELFGSRLFRIALHPWNTSIREYAYASIFINNSCWYPRFEIGVWKFIKLEKYEKKSCEKGHHFIQGFGEDIFQDYRGNVENPWDEINYWIWIKDGKIVYRSYPEERFLPRHKPQRRQWNDCHGILISSEDLKRHSGISDDFTPMVPDEILLDKNKTARIIKTKSSQPAARLLTWF